MTNPKHTDWTRFHGTFEADPNKKVSKVDFQVETNDLVSSNNGSDRNPVYFTDVQFQAGKQLTGWVPNSKEMLKRLTWTYDQWVNVPANSAFQGTEPTVTENVEKRLFNITGRGHKTVVVPNYFPEDWDVPILPTGIDLTMYPKGDFDLLRISTNLGATLPEEERYLKRDDEIYQEMKSKYESVTADNYNGTQERYEQEVSNFENIIVPLLENHPLDTRFTREFWVDGNTAGTEIKVHAEPRIAEVGGETVPIVGEREIDVNGYKIPIGRKKYMLAPKGTATLRFEFYKEVERTLVTYDKDDNYDWIPTKKTFRYLEDVGIAYHGTAEFYQWTYGKSRL